MKDDQDKLKHLETFLVKLISILPREDQRTCRLLNHRWKSRVDEHVLFNIRLTDESLSKFRAPSSSFRTRVLVEDLWGPITKQHHKFLACIRQLCLERPPDTSDDEPPQDRRSPTIAFDNIITFLYQAFNVEMLEINSGGLNHPDFSRYTFANLSLALRRLKSISITVTGTEEFSTLRRMFGQFFPNLESVSVAYRGIRWADSFESYLDVLLFILKHKATMKSVALEDPPMVPRIKRKLENLQHDVFMVPFTPKRDLSTQILKHSKQQNSEKISGEPQPEDSFEEPVTLAATYGSYMALFREQFAQVKLEKLCVVFAKNKFSSWGLGIQFIEAQRSNLVDVTLDRLPPVLAERLAWENSSTLKRFCVQGIKTDVLPQLSKDFNCSSLKNCVKLVELVLQDFQEILCIDRVPMRNLRTLILATDHGKIYQNVPLCSHETAVMMVENLVSARKIMLTRASMITCQLYKRFCDLPNLKQFLLIGFKGQARNKFSGTGDGFAQQRERDRSISVDLMIRNNSSSKNSSVDRESPGGRKCSDVSLCPSCVRILFPSTPTAPAKSQWGSLPSNIRKRVLSYLPREDLCSARLVSRQFSSDAQKCLIFGFCLSDKTKDFVCETNVRRIEYLAVANLRNCVPPEKLYFARNVRTLVLEYNEEALLSNDGSSNDAREESSEEMFARENLTIEKAFGVGKEGSIQPRNIVGLLSACYNLKALFFNQWALSNFWGSSRVSIKSKVFQNMAYRNLRSLHFVVHSSEVDAMIQFLSLDFNAKMIELEKLSIEIVGAPKARSSVEIYESIFKFVGNHDTLTDLRLVDQVFSSDYNSKVRNDIEPTLSMVSDKCRCCCIKILTSIHLQKLTVIFKENSTKWNLGFVFLRAQRYLTEVWLEGLPLNEVHTVILNSAETLASIYVCGAPSGKKKSAFNFSYTKNCHQLRRITVKNVDVENMQDLSESIQVLEINTIPAKNTVWSISPSLNRIRGRATISQKIARNFFRKLQNLEKIALINLGCLGVEVLRLFLQLPVLIQLVVTDIHEDARKELDGLKGVSVDQYCFSTSVATTAGTGGGAAAKTPSKQQLAAQVTAATATQIKIDRSVFSPPDL